MLNTQKIKNRLFELGLNQGDIAEVLSISRCTVSQKLNNIRGTTLDEANKLSTLLEISADEFEEYFFS